jgi:UDP-hydrolysing UDP-N-acetyl-D-glucosamine 2-epimerase
MKITIISGSRADAGALSAVWETLAEAGHDIRWRDIGRYPKSSRFSVANSTAEVLGGVAVDLATHPTDLIILHGDRYEVLAAAVATFLMGIPIAHIGGGDITEGSQDDSMRHAITKLSHLHFASNTTSAYRIIQMGEDPACVHITGCPGVDSLLDTVLLKPDATRAAVGLPDGKYFVVSLHPNTLEGGNDELYSLLTAMNEVKDVNYVLVDPNMDAGRKDIDSQFEILSCRKDRPFIYKKGLDREVYLSLLKHSAALIGNSSSGFYEAPYLGTPVINIGNRQKGRFRTAGMIQCHPISKNIAACMNYILARGVPVPAVYPYGDGTASEKIAAILTKIDLKTLTRKKFNQQECESIWPLIQSGKKSIPNVSGDDGLKKSLSGGLQGTTTTYQVDPTSGSLIWDAERGRIVGS